MDGLDGYEFGSLCTILLKNTKLYLKIRTKSSDWKFYRD